MPDPEIRLRVLCEGNTTKPDPFTIAFIANPALEAPIGSGQFLADSIVHDEPAFDACVAHAVDSFFGDLPHQGERLLAPPDIRDAVRVVSLVVSGLTAESQNSLVGQDSMSNLLIARRTAFRPFLGRFNLDADIAYGISASDSHRRASAWFTSDDTAGGGIPFDFEGATFHHCFRARIPGTVGMHAEARSLTPLHELGHALSSYENGKIVDLYTDGKTGINNLKRRPIPSHFARYGGVNHSSDLVRDGLGYPPGWESYHCELHFPSAPAVMDNYRRAASPLSCENDVITRRFLQDRLRAKIGR